jgi:hypothetical protein
MRIRSSDVFFEPLLAAADLFWFHYSGLSAAMSQYIEVWAGS